MPTSVALPTSHQTWNWVTGSVGHLGHLSRPGHRVISLTRCEARVFPVFEKKAQDKDIKIYIFVKIRPTVIEILTFNKWSSKFYFPEACKRQTAIKTCKPLAHCKRLSAVQHKSTFGVHYRTGSPGQLGLRVAGFPGHWVAGSQNVTQFHVCQPPLSSIIKSRRLTFLKSSVVWLLCGHAIPRWLLFRGYDVDVVCLVFGRRLALVSHHSFAAANVHHTRHAVGGWFLSKNVVHANCTKATRYHDIVYTLYKTARNKSKRRDYCET